MHIRSQSLENFRLYSRLEQEWPTGAILIYGANAQGKTSLLEALYYLATGRSPLTHVDRQVINWTAEQEGMSYARLRAEVVSQEHVREIELVLAQNQTKNGATRLQKQLRVDRQKRPQRHLAGNLNVVLFLPEDMDLIAGPPGGRRRYLDDTLSQIDQDYSAALNVYNNALRQRNALLRHLAEHRGDTAQLDPLDELLAQNGVIVSQGRRRLIATLSQHASQIHSDLSGGDEWLQLDYCPNFDPAQPPALDYQMQLAMEQPAGPPAGISADDLLSAFRTRLRQRRHDEITRGTTLTGPHRDEMRFIANDRDMGIFGSRGQQRTAVLALKIAQLTWMEETTGESPVLLLDEVMAELDTRRRGLLLQQVERVDQAFLTATDQEMFSSEFRENASLFEVKSGIVRSEG